MRRAALLLLVGLAVHPAAADVELRLEDGRVLEGVGLETEGGFYLLELERGGVITVPVGAVDRVRLSGDDDREPTGFVLTTGATLVGPPQGVHLPTLDKQVRALGPPSVFRKSIIDPVWFPTSAYDTNPERNNFNPARWFKAPIDPSWTPRSAFGRSSDVTQFNPARWFEAPIDSTWWPTEGFGWRERKPLPEK